MNLIRRLLLRAYSALRCAIYSQRIADASNILRQHDIPARRHIALTMRRAKHYAFSHRRPRRLQRHLPARRPPDVGHLKEKSVNMPAEQTMPARREFGASQDVAIVETAPLFGRRRPG